MQRATTLIASLMTLLLVIAIGAWWYMSNQVAREQSAVVTDRSVLIHPHSPSEGRSDAQVVIVEFFDPACGT